MCIQYMKVVVICIEEDRSEAYDFGCGELKDKHQLVKEKMCGSERGWIPYLALCTWYTDNYLHRR